MLGIRLEDPIGRLIGAPVATIRPTDTLQAAAEALAADHVGLLVVVSPRGVHGVLSERDVVSAVVDGVELDQTRVSDYASSELVMAEESDTVLDAAAAMATAEVRHLAVANQGVVTGVISIRDVLAVVLEQQGLISV
ncbi:MAG: CBS domain-containing protein [Nitriliruptoraceae bacterium]|nr:CBS domain-containing protein [Nitriliruptoraceae bacterium]